MEQELNIEQEENEEDNFVKTKDFVKQGIDISKISRAELKKAYLSGGVSKEDYADAVMRMELTPKKKKEKRIYEAVNEEEFIKLLEKTKKKEHRIAFILAYGSGLRLSEVKNLKPTDIKFTEKKIFIRQAKGSKDRVTSLTRYFKQDYLNLLPLKMTMRAIQIAFLSASIKAGINQEIYIDGAGRKRYRLHYHSLRHSFATRMIESGMPINQLQILLGHSNISTTNAYTKANPSDAITKALEIDK